MGFKYGVEKKRTDMTDRQTDRQTGTLLIAVSCRSKVWQRHAHRHTHTHRAAVTLGRVGTSGNVHAWTWNEICHYHATHLAAYSTQLSEGQFDHSSLTSTQLTSFRLNRVRYGRSQPRQTGSHHSRAWLRLMTAQSVKMKWTQLRWSEVRWVICEHARRAQCVAVITSTLDVVWTWLVSLSLSLSVSLDARITSWCCKMLNDCLEA